MHSVFAPRAAFFGVLVLIAAVSAAQEVTSQKLKAPHTGDAALADSAEHGQFPKGDGYRGIWFALGQRSKHGDKYSGGLGTYTANHVPIAIYAPEVDKTFFVYGGTIEGKRHLLIMASYYDHKQHPVPRPTIVHDKHGVDDPHDNASLAIDADGHIWVFISGRGRGRPGFKYRSTHPWSVDAFELVSTEEMTYPQPHYLDGNGFLHLLTKYTKGRELYWETSKDGRTWSPMKKLAGFGGHYQVSGRAGNKIGTAFMWHPDGNVDKRTNLYYLQTQDMGQSWTTAKGEPVDVPLTSERNDALLIDYHSQGQNVYIHDLAFDERGQPVILYLTSKGAEPGPENDPRQWRTTRWNGQQWLTSDVCISDHNYDTGSLYLESKDRWLVVGPTEPGPQPPHTGGEMAVWLSSDQGQTWRMQRQITASSESNHSYARRPQGAKAPFNVFWADGDPTKVSPSRLYFSDLTGERYWRLPDRMEGDFAEPRQMSSN